MERIPRISPNSNSNFARYHWFRQHVRKESVIQNIDSKNQKSYIFTEGLQGELFSGERRLASGGIQPTAR